MAEWTLSTCRSCTAQIVMARTAMGRTMPVDPRPVPGGTVKLTPRSGVPGNAPEAKVVPARLAFGRRDLHQPHWASCPYADSHRRRGVRP